MSADRVFVDTNVFVYLFDDAEPRKRDAARARLDTEGRTNELVVSTQVLQELYVALRRGTHPIASADAAERAVREVSALHVVQVDVRLVLAAIAESQAERVSFWDALVLCAASHAGCAVLLSEDLNAGQTYARVRVENPFAP